MSESKEQQAARHQAIVDLKREANTAKSDLIRLSDKMRTVSVRQAQRLDNIIARLEVWQNEAY